MEITLKNLKVNYAFSQETLCFKADVYINGVKVAYASNDGCGGCTNVLPTNLANGKILEEAEKYCLTLPENDYGFKDNLDGVIDNLVFKMEKEKEVLKFKKAVEKSMLKGLVVGKLDSYELISWKGQTISSMLKHPTGIFTLKLKIKELRKQGLDILNTNIPKDFLV